MAPPSGAGVEQPQQDRHFTQDHRRRYHLQTHPIRMSTGTQQKRSQGHYASLKKYYEEHPEMRSQQARESVTAERRIAQKSIGRRVFSRPEVQAKSLASRLKNPVMKKGVENHSAKVWNLRDPSGVTHSFRNLLEFVRNNEPLFETGDAVWVKKGRHDYCRAHKGLSKLSPGYAHPSPSWKGWTWNTVYERRFNDGDCLLGRDSAPVILSDKHPK